MFLPFSVNQSLTPLFKFRPGVNHDTIQVTKPRLAASGASKNCHRLVAMPEKSPIIIDVLSYFSGFSPVMLLLALRHSRRLSGVCSIIIVGQKPKQPKWSGNSPAEEQDKISIWVGLKHPFWS
jgi:hypothetical protein